MIIEKIRRLQSKIVIIPKTVHVLTVHGSIINVMDKYLIQS